LNDFKGGPVMKIIAIGLTVIFFISCAAKVMPPEVKPPEILVHKDCNSCHLPHKMNEKPLLNKPLSELCISCHPERVGKGEHAIGIKPQVAVEELPLDTDGKMTCITCHDPHGSTGFGSLLRAPDFNALCIKCHREI